MTTMEAVREEPFEVIEEQPKVEKEVTPQAQETVIQPTDQVPTEPKIVDPRSDVRGGEDENFDDTVIEPARVSPAPSILVVIPSASDFDQMESFLRLQLEKCAFYQKTFHQQRNESLRNQFETYYALTQKDLELLQKCKRETGRLPKFKFEIMRVTSVPINVDVKERELQLVIRTSPIPVAEDSTLYVVGEFDYPTSGKEETVTETAERWVKNIKIEPKNVWCCSAENQEQLDMISAVKNKPFYDKGSNLMEFERPMLFYVDKPRSRSLRRKFKPIKLNFWEKRNLVSRDRRIGAIQVKIDDISDEASLVVRTNIMMGRKATEHMANIRVRVREPLVNRALKTHEEKILVLT